jgi:hypothetical protein
MGKKRYLEEESMIPRQMAYDPFDHSGDDITPGQAVQQAMQYRWTADYIAENDAALSRYLRQKADECERLALTRTARHVAYAGT